MSWPQLSPASGIVLWSGSALCLVIVSHSAAVLDRVDRVVSVGADVPVSLG
jgi:hypothetical protein